MVVLSTAHIQAADGHRLDLSHYHRATWSDGAATLWYLPDAAVVPFSEIRDHVHILGFSEEFLNLLATLREEGYVYILFDSDGEIYDDLPVFEW